MYRLLNTMLMDEEQGEGGGGGPSAEVQANAKSAGWVPKAEWRGSEDKWVDADAYLERSEKVLPIVLARNRTLEKDVAELRAAQEQMNADVRQFKTVTENAIRAEYEDKLAEAQATRAQAITDGDGAATIAAEREEKRLETERDKKLKETAAPKGGKQHPDWAPWVAQNPWFKEDRDLAMVTEAVALRLINEANTRGETLIGKPLFERAKAEVARMFPAKFEGKPRGENDVEDDTVGRPEITARKGGKRGYAELPQEAKAACQRFIDKGWIEAKDKAGKDIPLKDRQEAYAKTYFSQKGV